jgi:hypothetical protein
MRTASAAARHPLTRPRGVPAARAVLPWHAPPVVRPVALVLPRMSGMLAGPWALRLGAVPGRPVEAHPVARTALWGLTVLGLLPLTVHGLTVHPLAAHRRH